MKHKILIVVDAQNDFIDGSLANPVAQERVKNIVEKINTFDGDFIFVTKDTHEGNYLSTKEGEKLPVAHCIRGTDGWQVNKDVTYALVKRANDCSVEVVEKPTFGSFELALKIMNIIGDEYEIEIVGFCTDICVAANAMMLKTLMYSNADIKVIENCCAGTTPENHEAALAVMKSCQIDVV